ncbi:MAG: hypothetical protein HY057_14515, partial [Rhodospirillales bacterium]|nr:hypothetical protein [Rhodospirillales bacterium]
MSTSEILVQRCVQVEKAAADAIGWIADARRDSPAVDQRATALTEKLQRIENAARRLGRAAGRRMCIGVFGPSQAGKSYLVNSFGRRKGQDGRGDQPFTVDFAGRKINFIEKINPQNERESTGQVTRFSTALPPADAAFPIRVRLFSEPDVVKILVNSFQYDFDQHRTRHRLADRAAIDERLSELEARAGAAGGRTGASDVFDVRDYYHDNFPNMVRDFAAAGYWERAARLVGRLDIDGRARLFALLWGDLDAFTGLYVSLVGALARLDFCEEAFCPLEALVDVRGNDVTRRTDSIVNVQTLELLGKSDDRLLALAVGRDGRAATKVELPRSLVAALIAELQLSLHEPPYAFFEHVDVLDFPGTRTRLGVTEIDEALKNADVQKSGTTNPLAAFLLRGKVGYMIERFTAEREITGMLLCLPSGNQEVNATAPLVNHWIDLMLGETPAARAANPNTLFLVFTKFDDEFRKSEGQDDNSRRLRWRGRIEEWLLKYFQAKGWPSAWNAPDAPFDNVFWLRNPSVEQKHLMRYRDGKEIGVEPDVKPFVDKMRGFYLDTPLIRKHVANADRAFDAALAVLDGGVGYLVDALSRVIAPDLKLRQIGERIEEQARQLAAVLERFHDSDDDERRARRRAVAARVVEGLLGCVGAQRFGEFLAYLQLDEDEIWRLYLGVADWHATTGGDRAASASVSARADVGKIASRLGVRSATNGADDRPGGAPAMDRAEKYADEVIRRWTDKVLRLPGQPTALARFAIAGEVLRDFADELVKGAGRSGLRATIAERARAETRFANTQWDRIAARQVLVTRMILARYIDYLGVDALPAERRPGVPPHAPERK